MERMVRPKVIVLAAERAPLLPMHCKSSVPGLPVLCGSGHQERVWAARPLRGGDEVHDKTKRKPPGAACGIAPAAEIASSLRGRGGPPVEAIGARAS
jgi:hypothetical protein